MFRPLLLLLDPRPLTGKGEGQQNKQNCGNRFSKKEVKSASESMHLGESVGQIRRFQKGDLMLKLKKSAGKTAKNFLGKVENFLGEEEQVRAKKQMIVIQRKYIDEATTKEGIREVLEKELGQLVLLEFAMRGPSKTFGGTHGNY